MRYAGGAAHVEWESADASSALRRCEYSLDAGNWTPMEAVDGVIDSPRERFALDLNGLAPGEHLLVLRVADSANNTATARVIPEMTLTAERLAAHTRNRASPAWSISPRRMPSASDAGAVVEESRSSAI